MGEVITIDDKRIKEPVDKDFQGKQLTLFQTFLSPTEQTERYSNTVDVWDNVPKYFISRREMNKLRTKEGFLPNYKKICVHKGKEYSVEIFPGRITFGDGKTKEYYPSAREELVEDALRKFATIQQQGFKRPTDSGVVFTLFQLRQELKARGHTMSFQEVRESLYVLARCRIVIKSEDKKTLVESAPISELAAVSQYDYEKDRNACWVAIFSSLVSDSLNRITYRQYDYYTMMSHSTQLTRWLHKRLSSNYTQASHLYPYSISFLTIKRDSGLLNNDRIRREVSYVNAALDELETASILSSITKIIKTEKRTIIDVIYTLMPTNEFISQVKAANKRLALAKQDIGL